MNIFKRKEEALPIKEETKEEIKEDELMLSWDVQDFAKLYPDLKHVFVLNNGVSLEVCFLIAVGTKERFRLTLEYKEKYYVLIDFFVECRGEGIKYASGIKINKQNEIVIACLNYISSIIENRKKEDAKEREEALSLLAEFFKISNNPENGAKATS